MSAAYDFNRLYNPKNLVKFYHEKVRFRATVGLDRVTPQAFDSALNENLEIISRKVSLGTYQFTRYREILISKGRDKEPRVISIPTIRDKLTLCVLHAILQNTFQDTVQEPLLHSIIGEITKTIQTGKYDSFVKIDITKFYASIDHDLLIQKISKKIRKQELRNLIRSAISTETIASGSAASDHKPTGAGVPEGLSISNILADIYLAELDKFFAKRPDIAYFRYVDDILILCTASSAQSIKDDITSELKNYYKLETNKDKTRTGVLSDGVPYLGYVFYQNKVSIRPAAKQKIENALEELFRLRKHKTISDALFEWRLNLKIAGCIYEHKKYGWMFYYSQLTDLQILYHLDWFVDKLFTRFGFSKPNDLMRFVRVYHEITKNVSRSTYLINADRYTSAKKAEVLKTIYGANRPVPKRAKDIDSHFREAIFKEIQKLEHDIQSFS